MSMVKIVDRVAMLLLILLIVTGCVYSDHYVGLSSSALCVEDGVVTMREAERELSRRIFYPIGFRFCRGDGWDCLLGELFCHIPTLIPEVVFNNINDRRWVETISLPIFESGVSIAENEVHVIGHLDGFRLDLRKKGADDRATSNGMESVVFRVDPSQHQVRLRGTTNDGKVQREVDFGLWSSYDKIFSYAGDLYVVEAFNSQSTEWLIYRYNDTGPNPVLWRVDPDTGVREVMVSFAAGKFIIENRLIDTSALMQ